MGSGSLEDAVQTYDRHTALPLGRVTLQKKSRIILRKSEIDSKFRTSLPVP